MDRDGVVPVKPGSRGAHKLTDEVVAVGPPSGVVDERRGWPSRTSSARRLNTLPLWG